MKGALAAVVALVVAVAAGIVGTVAVMRDRLERPDTTVAVTQLTAAATSGEVVDSLAAEAKTVEDGVEDVPSPVEGAAVFTSNGVRAGQSAGAGQVLAEANGRPVVVLPGRMRAFRQLGPGARGGDVAQLQDALASLGYASGRVRGVYGEWTARGLGRLWRNLGYFPVRADGSPIFEAKDDDAAVLRPGEAFFAGVLPLRVLSACGELRKSVQGPLCSVAAGGRKLVVSVPRADAAKLNGGEEVVLQPRSGRAQRTGVVEAVPAAQGQGQSAPSSSQQQAGDSAHMAPQGHGGTGAPQPGAGQAPGGTGAAQPGAAQPGTGAGGSGQAAGDPNSRTVDLAVRLTDAQTLPEPGAQFSATIVLRRSAKDSVVVPSTALRQDAGRAWVRTAEGRDIEVTAGVCAQGRCALTETGGLMAGQKVVVGEARGRKPGAGE
ncbi:peptidoglycan-binding domain-containing protein [Arthrobacter sp. UM1]|uniref:peptidoglycan-binding domain-containing protein n=1 Tax=Arthrobacter sp. UM1 TaxID=2766776 RepID=UPI001CF63A93|nr:peptidoglycan-binding domain-containing protein [Arthrobacter sp. UM1]MCB4208882.1 peptidoglycan-binding protein [Arthrobacter sp. UM1]